jgi:hypothetical protein
MTLTAVVEPAADREEISVEEHLGVIERMYREALAHSEALVQPWRNLSPRFGEGALEVVEQRLMGQPPVRTSLSVAA